MELSANAFFILYSLGVSCWDGIAGVVNLGVGGFDGVLRATGVVIFGFGFGLTAGAPRRCSLGLWRSSEVGLDFWSVLAVIAVESDIDVVVFVFVFGVVLVMDCILVATTRILLVSLDINLLRIVFVILSL